MSNQGLPRAVLPPRVHRPRSLKRGVPYSNRLPRWKFNENEGAEGKLYQLHVTKGWKAP